MINVNIPTRICCFLVAISLLVCSNLFAQATADFSINTPIQCIDGNNFSFTNTSTAPSGSAITYKWDFRDGTTSTLANPTKTYTTAGTYSVQLIATVDGIDHYVSHTVSVNPMPVVDFSSLVATSTGNSYTFQSLSTISSGSMNYSWDFGDGNTGITSNPTHTYTTTGLYSVSLTVTSDQGCSNSSSKSVIVTISSSGNGAPGSFGFRINQATQCLAGNSFIFTDTSSLPTGTTYKWNFGDGTGSTYLNPTKTYSAAGTYTVKLIATLNGTDYTTSKSVTVTTTPTVNIIGNNCTGSTLTATVNTGNINGLVWKNGTTVVQNTTPSWGTTSTVVAGGNGAGTSANQLQTPKGIYVDKAGNVYVIDNYQSRVQKWTPRATSGVTVATGLQITGVGVDDSGNVYTVDDINNWVQKWTGGSLTPTTVAGGNGWGNAANQFDNPRGNLYIDAAGNIYIPDFGNNRIQKWAIGATTGVTVAGGNGYGSANNQLANAMSFQVDAAGNVYVADEGNSRVVLWTVGATTGIAVAGGNGGGSAANQFSSGPDLVYVDAAGNIYGVDQFQGRIQMWPSGATSGVTVFGGSYGSAPHDQPFVYLDTNTGDLYVLDQSNNKVLKYTLGAITNTFTPTTAGSYTVTVNQFGGCGAATSSPITISQATSPAITIATDGANSCNNTICAGTTLNFTATITDGGASPTIQWKVNGSNGITGASFTTSSLNNNDIVTAELTSSASSCVSSNPATSNTITVAVKTIPTATITGSGCTGNSLSLTGTGLSGSTITWLAGGVPIAAAAPSIDTNAVTVAGNLIYGNGASDLRTPNGIFIDANNTLYIADLDNYRVQKWLNGASSGTTIAGTGTYSNCNLNEVQQAYGVFVDKDNNLYVADANCHRIVKWASGATSGVIVAGTGVAGNSATQLFYPKSIFIDDCGNMYVADTYNNRIQKFSNGSSVGVTVAGTGVNGSSATQLSYPTHVQVDALGNIYVADNGNSRIQKFTAGSSTAITVAGTGVSGNTNNQLNEPWEIFVDGGGNVYVADTYNNRIMFWANGATTGVKIAGTGNYGNGANGLNYPTHVFVNANGDVYVADSHNNRVQKFSAVAPSAIIPITTGTYTAVISNTYGCSVTSNAITVANCIIPTISIATGSGGCQTNVCAGSSITFTASATNAGSSPTYQWKINSSNAGTNSNTFTTSSLNNNDIVTCDIKNNDAGAYPYFVTSDSIIVSISPSPVLNISGGTCLGNTLAVNSTSALSSLVWSSGITTLSTSTPTWNGSGVTVAGGIQNGANHGPAELNSPTDVYVDNAGNIYVSDLFNNRIQKFPAGSVSGTNAITVAGQSDCTGGPATNQLFNNHGFTLDALGNIYITNSGYHRIDRWAPNATSGIIIAGIDGIHGNASNQFFIPRRMVIDGCGNMYITDTYNHRVQKWTVGATSGITVAGGNGQGNSANQLNYPTDVAIDAQGNIYVADAGNNRIQKFPANSTSSTNGVTVAGTGSAGSGLNQLDNPQGIYVDGAGNIYVADANNVRIMYWAAGATTGVLAAGGNGYGNAPNQLNYPTNVTIDKQGNLFVADEHNNRIQEFTIAAATYKPTTTGTYTITTTNNNGCVASQNVSITDCSSPIIPIPTFTVNIAKQCIGVNQFVFTNTSVAATGTTYRWDFADGTTSTDASPVKTYTSQGSYNVTMIATYGGIDYYTHQTITVSAKPVASFIYTNNTGTGNNYTFNSTSTIASGNMNYAWDFGDNTTVSGVSNPLHNFTNSGTFPVKLVVTSDDGCADSIIQSLVVCPALNNQAFSINAASSCLTGNYWGVISYFGNTAGYPMTYLWDYGDGTSSTLQSPPQHTYSSAGNYTIKLTATLAYPGCAVQTGTYSVPAIVNPMPVAAFNITGSPTTMCYTPSNNYTFNNASTITGGYMNYAWDFGDTTFSTGYSPSHSYTHAGVPDLNSNNGKIFIKLIATSDNNCKDSITQLVKLYNVPTATDFIIRGVYGTPGHPLTRDGISTYFSSLVPNDTIQCFGGFNWFGHQVEGIFTSPSDYWKVNFDDGTSGTGSVAPGGALESPFHVYTSPGVHTFSGNMISSNGCLSNTIYGSVTITPNTDTLPHSVIGLSAEVTTNVGIDPYLGHSYNHYKLFYTHLGSTSCRPIISAQWRISYLSGNTYWNHGYFDLGPYAGILPTTADSAYFSFDADTSNTFQIRLITMNDLGMTDTAYATYGATNSGYTSFRSSSRAHNPELDIYPNPATENISVSIKPTISGMLTIQLYDALGRLLQTKREVAFSNLKERHQLNIANLSKGVYLIEVTDSNGQLVGLSRFMKDK